MMQYTINGGAPNIETTTDTINPGDTMTYCFVLTADLSADGNYDFVVSTLLNGDADTTNDSYSFTVVNQVTPTAADINATGDTICANSGDTLTLVANSSIGEITWYDSLGGTMVGSGDTLQNIDIVVGSQDFRFIGGSFGAASGEAFIAGAQHAIENKIPYIFFSCSGGQRMMESSIALMQMSRTALAVNELKKKNIPFMVVLTNPTTGGVTASWAMLGDILIAEPKATIGFAGRRVIQDTVRETLPDEFQTAEYVKDHGGIDLVVERKYLNTTIGTLLNVLLKKQEAQAKQDSNVTVDKSLQAAS